MSEERAANVNGTEVDVVVLLIQTLYIALWFESEVLPKD